MSADLVGRGGGCDNFPGVVGEIDVQDELSLAGSIGFGGEFLDAGRRQCALGGHPGAAGPAERNVQVFDDRVVAGDVEAGHGQRTAETAPVLISDTPTYQHVFPTHSGL
ncbi:hypothetical protein ACTXG6_43860 [Pseudonocardia sp. Cha107L01]|uniref:hypothetical protein n=1 Tax=Pseudonocardia sp. Cha107L01 TaxID=3457576 RepID=UPI00403EE275